jgi:hypothetical protein
MEPKAASAVWVSETPSLAFRSAWSSPRDWLKNRELIANPAASSAAELILNPLLSRSKARESDWLFFRWERIALLDAVLVLILKPMESTLGHGAYSDSIRERELLPTL